MFDGKTLTITGTTLEEIEEKNEQIKGLVARAAAQCAGHEDVEAAERADC